LSVYLVVVVLVLLPNIPQIVIANYAAWRIGAVTAMNNPLYTERELAYQLDLSDATLLVTLDLLHPRAMNLMKSTPLEKVGQPPPGREVLETQG